MGAYLEGKKWMIPENTTKPIRQIRHSNKNRSLLGVLVKEKESQVKGGIYHKLQIEMFRWPRHSESPSRLFYDSVLIMI